MRFLLGNFVIDFDDIRHEFFEEAHYRGVVFFAADGFRYEVIESVLGTRILITHQTEYGHLRDMPFHEGTFGFLPDNVRAKRKEQIMEPVEDDDRNDDDDD